jgi:hypothetical protein
MYKIDEIKKSIKDNLRTFIYYIDAKKNINMIIKANGKNEAKNKLIELINNHKVKTDGYFMLLKITSHTGTKWGHGGLIVVLIDLYYVHDYILKNVNVPPALKYKKEGSVMTGAVWFTKYFLETKGWNYEYIDNIVNRLTSGKSILEKLLTTEYHVKFIR